MKKIFIISSLIMAILATPSFAEPTELDKKTVASKAYVDTKQDIIETGLVNYYSAADEETKQVPSLVSYDSTNGLNGNQIGILDYENTNNDGFLGLTGSEMDNFVPTVRAVADEFNYVWDELDKKQYIIPGGSAGNVVTYTGNEGEVGSATVSSAATYLGTTLTNGDSIANITAVETKQDKFTCAGYEPGHEGDLDYCWLYGEIEVAVASCKPDDALCDKNTECCSGRCKQNPSGNKVCVGN